MQLCENIELKGRNKLSLIIFIKFAHVQDINLHTAETGNWHGTFQNLLAQGKVRDNKDDVETITDIESSGAVMNSLFMDSHIVGRPNTTTTTTTTIATSNNASL